MRISVKVVTRSKRDAVEGPLPDGSYRVHTRVPPVEGAANQRVRELLAKHLGIAPSTLSLVSGQTASRKVFTAVRSVVAPVLGLLQLLGLWVALNPSPSVAQTPDVRYFVAAGVHPWFPHGDLGGRGRSTLIAENGQEETLIAGPQVFSELELVLGARVDGSTVSLQLGLATPDAEIQPDAVRTVQASWLRFDFVYMYSFRHRDEWQPRLGLGYGFSRLQVPQANLRRNGAAGSALFSGSGPQASLGVGWFPWRHGGFTLDGRYRLITISHLTNSEGEYFELDSPLREGMVGLGFSAVWVF